MKNIGPISFQDLESGDDAFVYVRYDEQMIAVCLSLKSNGDVEVFMNRKTAAALQAALKEALDGN